MDYEFYIKIKLFIEISKVQIYFLQIKLPNWEI